MRRKVGTIMRISTFWFCMKQGLVNICRNIWFSLASTAIISACIFLFCVFFSVITNIEYMVRTAETFYPMMAAIALALGGGLGFFVSFFTIRKELRV